MLGERQVNGRRTAWSWTVNVASRIVAIDLRAAHGGLGCGLFQQIRQTNSGESNVLRKKSLTAVALAVGVSMAAASCGSDEKTESTTAATTATTAAPATTAAATETTAEATETTAEATETTEESTETTAEATETTEESTETTSGEGGGDLEALAAECTAEGAVNLIALPDEWANYKGIIADFAETYPGVKHDVANPEGSSKEEMEAVQTLAGQDDQPDIVDVSPAIAQAMVDEGLFEPYTPTVAAEVPEGLQDPDGNWFAAYFGIMAITTNTTIVPNAPTRLRRPHQARIQGPGVVERRPA